jgi:choline dehydrogenase-like flavoprotein
MNDPEFYAAAWDEYNANKTGPLTHAWGNRIAFTSLQDLDPQFESIADALDAQEPLDHLPPIYAENPSLVEGFLKQRDILQSQFRNPEAGVVEITFGGANAVPVALQKALSRGTIFINSTDPDPSISPLIDFNVNSNPVDTLILIRAFQKAREFMSAPSVASLEPMEIVPGATVDTEADIKMTLRDSLLMPSFDHPVGTAAMMPREWGGVVVMSLRVYSVEGVQVVEMMRASRVWPRRRTLKRRCMLSRNTQRM